jgi:hypothetical protein
MTVRLARLENIPEIDETKVGANRRREPRYATWFDAQIENARGDSARIQLAEVSLHGCRISADQPWLRVGGFISISIDQGAKLQAIVRWVRDGAAGMEFLHAIPPECSEWHDLMDAPF